METLIVHPANQEQSDALKALMKAFKIAFEVKNSNIGFVAKVKDGEHVKTGEIESLT